MLPALLSTSSKAWSPAVVLAAVLSVAGDDAIVDGTVFGVCSPAASDSASAGGKSGKKSSA